MTAQIPLAETVPSLPYHRLDPDAVMVCRRLQQYGYEAFLVGGCVRDLLLDRVPKDFDIATSARPNEVKKLFRNCRLIGRRFRLAHVYFGPKILEVATFRGGEVETEPDSDELVDEGEERDHLIVRANNFGTPIQDAYSRDFTINGLFYDPVSQTIIDHVNGYSDVRAGIIRTIGEPVVRFKEDPVRILRAVKFSSRMGITIESDTLAAMRTVAEDIVRCPAARVTEEVYRILESTHSRAAMELMHQTGILPVILPEINSYLDDDPGDYLTVLEQLDHLGRAHGQLPREFVISVVFYPLALRLMGGREIPPSSKWGGEIEEWFREIGIRMHVPVRHRMRFRNLMAMMGRFLSEHSRHGRRRLNLTERCVLPQALSLLRIYHHLNGSADDAYEYWRTLAEKNDVPWVPNAPEPSHKGERSQSARGRGRQRRRRPYRKGSDSHGAPPDGADD